MLRVSVLDKLPGVVVAYLAADKAKDSDALSRCFVDDGMVQDEEREYRGRAAIRAWNAGTKAKYRYELELLDASVNGDNVLLFVRLSGEFPGSPIELDYAFTIADDKIESLAIG